MENMIEKEEIDNLKEADKLLSSLRNSLDSLKGRKIKITNAQANRRIEQTSDMVEQLGKDIDNLLSKEVELKTNGAETNVLKVSNMMASMNQDIEKSSSLNLKGNFKDRLGKIKESTKEMAKKGHQMVIDMKLGDKAKGAFDTVKSSISNIRSKMKDSKQNELEVSTGDSYENVEETMGMVDKLKKMAGSIMVRLNIQDGLRAVLDRAKELDSTLVSKFDAIGEKWESIKSSFMDKIALGVSPELSKMADSLMDILANVNFEGVGEAIGGVLSTVGQSINGLLDQIKSNPDAIKGMFDTINSAASNLGGALQTAFQMAKPLLDFVIANPGFALAFAGSIFVAAKSVSFLVTSINTINNVRKTFRKLKNTLTALKKVTGGSMKKMLGSIKGFAKNAMVALKSFFAFLMANPIILVITGIIILIMLLYQAWKNNWGGMRDVLTNVWEGLKTAFATGISFYIQGINALINLINKIPGINISKIEEPEWVKDSLSKAEDAKKVQETQNEKDVALREHLSMKNRSNIETPPAMDEISNASIEDSMGDYGNIDMQQFFEGADSYDYENIDTSGMASNKNQVNYNGTINISKLADQFVIKEEADVTKIIQSLVDKLTETRINFA